jgi:hypothetical protein
VVGGNDRLKDAPALVIGEGYATAASLAQSLGFATVAAFFDANTPRNGTYTEFDFSTISSRYFHFLQRI